MTFDCEGRNNKANMEFKRYFLDKLRKSRKSHIAYYNLRPILPVILALTYELLNFRGP